MIHDLDDTLKQLLIGELRRFGLRHPPQGSDYLISFDPPTKDFTGSPGASLVVNLYAYNVRENRELLNNQPQVRRNSDGTATSTQPPVWLDVYYLVSTWSLASTDKTREEHRMLSRVSYALLRNLHVIPAQVFPNGFPTDYSAVMRTARLPAFTAQPNSLEHLGEFWSTMENVWKPALVYAVTVPLDLEREVTGPMVTTKIVDHTRPDLLPDELKATLPETLMQIGGQVVDAADPDTGIQGATVHLVGIPDFVKELFADPKQHRFPLPVEEKAVHMTTTTDDQGRYRFEQLSAGNYDVTVRATGYQPGGRQAMRVPGRSDEYVIALQALTP